MEGDLTVRHGQFFLNLLQKICTVRPGDTCRNCKDCIGSGIFGLIQAQHGTVSVLCLLYASSTTLGLSTDAKLWESTNKPNGFEILEVRLGGIAAWMSTVDEKMWAFADGMIDTIPELTEESLVYKRRSDGSIGCTNTMDKIATPGRIDY